MDIGFEKLHDQETVNLIQQFVSFDGVGLDSLPKAPTTKKMDKSSKIQNDFLASTGKKRSDYDFEAIA